VQIHLERVDAMSRLLEALREQLDLFNEAASLEEAMEALFRQVGGGRVRGDELLDYRNYVRLTIQVQRMGGDRWEPADPSRLSTGEAIGVGTSVLIVILEAWERAAGLLRGRALGASLRFLFLDEATRLDADSLSMLIEFCERMELQLLLAAPAVGRARRGLTYRLVRTEDADGREQVVARGFRGLVAAP
jgi:chromosome partition protein MukB